ncbi:MAG: hypothetical protein MUF73_15145 [Rhodobacteraceae bacterium]|jgi:TRAP-type C4-dicarboxylate transport system permease small subunit|nr:hypothetical protein [Paracoccaceae bacterium]
MNQLVRLYIRHVAIGFALAALFTGLLLWFNVANLWHLVTHAPGGFLAVVLLVMFNGMVFSGVQFGIAVMSLADDDRDGGDRGQGDRHLQLIPIRHRDADPRARRDHRRP